MLEGAEDWMRGDGGVINVGLIGAGGIASAHARSLRAIPFVRLVAVSDPVGARARQLADQFAISHVFGSHVEMLEAGKVDVVHILTPPENHIPLAFDAIRSGVDAFIEKPLGLSAEECQALSSEAKALGRRVGVNHSDAHAPVFRRLMKEMASCRLGRVHHVIISYGIPRTTLPLQNLSHYMFNPPSNMLLEFGPHPFSMIRLLLGELKSITTKPSGRVDLIPQSFYYDTLACSIESSRGTAQVFFSFGQGDKEITIQLFGEDGRAFGDNRRGFVDVRWSTPRPAVENLGFTLRNGSANVARATAGMITSSLVKLRAIPFRTENGFSASISRFYLERRAGLPVSEDAEAGVEVVRYCARAAESF